MDVDNGESMPVWGQGYKGNLCIFGSILLWTLNSSQVKSIFKKERIKNNNPWSHKEDASYMDQCYFIASSKENVKILMQRCLITDISIEWDRIQSDFL